MLRKSRSQKLGLGIRMAAGTICVAAALSTGVWYEQLSCVPLPPLYYYYGL